jgi:hypothetical protein
MLYLYENMFSAKQITENKINRKNTTASELYTGPPGG